MKKIMFSVLACVAFAFSGFASNEVANEEKVSNENIVIETDVTESVKTNEQVEFAKDCFYRFVDSKGNLKGTIKITGVSDNVACNSDGMVKAAIALYTVSEGITKS